MVWGSGCRSKTAFSDGLTFGEAQTAGLYPQRPSESCKTGFNFAEAAFSDGLKRSVQRGFYGASTSIPPRYGRRAAGMVMLPSAF